MLDHEVILRTALAQHAKAIEDAHKKLVNTASKISVVSKDQSMIQNALSICYTYSYHAAQASCIAKNELNAAYNKYHMNSKRKREEKEDTDESTSTKKV